MQNDSMIHDIKFGGGGAFQTLLMLFTPYRWKLLGAVVAFFVKYAPVVAMPIIFSDIINVAVAPSGNPFLRIAFDGVVAAILLLLNIPAHTICARLQSECTRNMEVDLRGGLVRRLNLLSMGFIQDKQSGALQAKLLRDVETIQGLVNLAFNLFLAAFISIAVAVAITASRQPLFLLFYLLAVPFAVGVVQIFRRPMQDGNRRFRTEIERMSSRLSEMITLIPVTRAHGLEEVEELSVERQLVRVARRGRLLDMTIALFGATSWAFSQIMLLSCLLVSGYLALRGMIRPGDVVLYQSFFSMIVGSVSQIIDGLPAITRGMESVKSVGEIFGSLDIERNEGKEPVTAVQGRFDFEHVCFNYPNARGASVDDVSLTVEPGETIAVVGGSGAGKSTLMSLIIGFNRPTSGRILLDGRNMESLDLRQYRHWLSVVPQSTSLFSGSIRENITFGLPHVTARRIEEVLRMARIDEFLSSLPSGLDTRVGEHGTKLSGGQRQRVAIARALIRDPRVIILDEATSALDVVSEKLVQEAIGQLATGRTTFIVAHRLSTIRDASRIVVMKAGRIVEVGTHEELLKLDGEFAKLSNLQH